MIAPAKRVYYGWVIVAIGCGTMLFVQGSFASSGVLFAALTQEYGWSRATISLPFSVALVGYASLTWLSGRLFDRYGPRRLFPLGALCLGLGLILSAQARTPWQLCLTWGVLVGQGLNLIGFVPHLTQMSLWFHRRRGFASGLVLSGASMGTLILVPGLQYVVNGYGWRLAYTVLGLLVLGVLIPLTALWQRHRPADLGLYPDGAPAPPPGVAAPAAGPATTSWTLRDARRTRRFWYLFVMATCVGWLSNIINVHQIAHMVSNGFPSLRAAEVVAMLGLMRAVGSTFWGGLADRFGREGIYTTGICLCLTGLACLASLSPTAPGWLLYGYVVAYGLGFGVHGAVESTATADIFHGPHLGAILGALELGWGLGGFLGSWFGGFWYDHWGSYHGAFVLTMGVDLLGCLALWLAAPRHSWRTVSAPASLREEAL
jgi:MFS family permease